MTTTLARPDARTVMQAQRDRVEEITRPAFLDERVRPHLPAAPDGEWRTTTIQLDGSGAATVRVSLDDGPAVYAKLFPFEDGPLVHERLQALRAAGLGSGSAEQSVEPLAWHPDVRVLLCREAPGRAVSELVGGPSGPLVEGCARAGRWLGRLHTSGLAIGEPRSLLVTGELLSLAKRLAKVVAKEPDQLPDSLDTLALLEDLARETRDGLLVQSHGQYRPLHVFVTDEVTTVIDLDRTGPADPARDLAEFVHRLRVGVHSATGSTAGADEPADAFYAAYVEVAGRDGLTNLRFHRARYLAHSVHRKVKDGGTDDPRLALYRAELERVVSRPGPA